MINQWLEKMNPRERMLSLIIGSVLFLLLNLFLWSTLLGMSGTAREGYAKQRKARTEQEVYLQEEGTWQKRADWVKQKQPQLASAAEASSLLTLVKEIAGKYDVQVENPQIGAVEKTPSHDAVSATFETKSGWEPLVHFLYAAQKPENFTAFETVNLMVDSSESTVMRGRFKFAKWGAPGSAK